MSAAVKCDGCPTIGRRRIGKQAPEGWWSAELRDETSGEIHIVAACSDACRDAAIPWVKGATLDLIGPPNHPEIPESSPERGTLLRGVTPCDCGYTERLVVGFGVRVAGMVDVLCIRCDARSVMRPEVARELANKRPEMGGEEG